MKIYFIIFLFFYSWVQVKAQDRLIITHKAFGGPPTIPPRGTRTTEFVFKQKGDKFIAKNYTFFDDTFKDSKKKKIRFEKEKVISKSKIDSFINPKTPIYFKDLGFTIEDVRETAKSMHVTILPQNFDLLEPNFILNFDSLDFCRDKIFFSLHGSSVCGGTTTEVFHNKNRLFYYPDSYSEKEFDIKMYLKVYILIKDLPNISNYLSIQHLKKGDVLHWFVRFLENIQCEDYYASLFMKENPEYNTHYFKRTKKGWHFEEYLKKIKSNNKTKEQNH